MSVKLLVGLLRWLSGKESACLCRRPTRRVLILGSGRSPGEGNGNPLQYSFSLKNLFIYFNCRIITLQYFHGLCHIPTWISHRNTCAPSPLNKPLPHLPPHPILWGCHRAPALGFLYHISNSHHSSVLAWRIPWTEEPGGLQSTGPPRVRQDWACRHTLFYLISRQSLLLSFH